MNKIKWVKERRIQPQDFETLIKELTSIAQGLKAIENTNQSKDFNSNLENIQTLIKSLQNQLKLE